MNSPNRLTKEELEAEMFRANNRLQLSQLRQRIENSRRIGTDTLEEIFHKLIEDSNLPTILDEVFHDCSGPSKSQLTIYGKLLALKIRINLQSNIANELFKNDFDKVTRFKEILDEVNRCANKITAIRAQLFTQLTGWSDS